MARHACRLATAWLFLSLVSPAWGGGYFLYSPRPVSPGETKEAGEGVLVREVEVRPGDTLYGISRRNSGHGMYYPQILLFNDIKNPNLIRAGETIKVPVPRGGAAGEEGAAPPAAKKGARKAGRKHTAAPVAGRPSRGQLSELAGEAKPSVGPKKKRAAARQATSGGQEHGGRAAAPAPQPAVAEEARPVSVSRQEQGQTGTDAAAGQRLFERAVRAYRQNDCGTALDLFDRFLTSYPYLPQAADASLYKADCYLKLSGQ
ncbi:MAG TPA: LysM peptidoglycan-binding domain-containing protein [Desulfuromonadaceae bacterium]